MSSIEVHEVNVEALRTALRAMVPQHAEGIEHLYVLLDDSMRKGYEMGRHTDAENRASEAEIDRDNAWDNGYCAGVHDARAAPKKADNVVQDIIADSAADHYGAVDAEMEANWAAYAETVRDYK